MEKLKGYIQKKNGNKMILIGFLLICMLTGGFSFQYYFHLQSAIRGESRGYLQEISQRIGSNISRMIDTNYAALYSMSSALEQFEADRFAQIQPVVEAQKKCWDFQDILWIDEKGKAYRASGQEVVLTSDEYLDAIIHKRQGLSTTQIINNEERTVLMIPIGTRILDGKTMVAMAASYDQEAFEQTLSMTAFSGQAYSCIISTAGTMVIRPLVSDNIKLGYNVFSTIEGTTLDSGNSIQQIREDIKHDRSGQVGFTKDGVRYYMVYSPIAHENWHLVTFVPSDVVNEKSNMLLRITLFMCGIITSMFAGLTVLLLVMFYRNKSRLEQIAYVDKVTGGNTIQKFYELAQETLDAPNSPSYALVYTNVQKFKLLNEQFGREACDRMLKMFSEVVNGELETKECIGRLTADNFCILLQYDSESVLLKRFQLWYERACQFWDREKPIWPLPIMEFGVYVIEGDRIPFAQTVDRAKLALREFARPVNSKLQYAIYNHDIHKRLYREKQLEDMMETALNNQEFRMFLQPKYRARERQIGGAEALVRWISPTEGMIFPNEFIPLFEKNGFIIQLDLWMFEQVCVLIRSWMDQGKKPVKISVNCSRVQLNHERFLDRYAEILGRYQIPPEFIEIELTESVVMEDVERLTKIINDIHDLGFGCSMDDFGSGYSSLNLIQSIPVDTLKLDQIFFRQKSPDPKRTESVIESIISMANALSMVTVAEGIEDQDQVEMLARIGCDYIQGYVFAKPMPVEEFEALAFEVLTNRKDDSHVQKP